MEDIQNDTMVVQNSLHRMTSGSVSTVENNAAICV
jgi:hypothetical protein